MARLAVLLNRTAYRFARDPALVTATENAAGPDAVIVDTRDLAELDAAVHQIRHAAPTVVAICGGDGSYMAGLTALRRVYAPGPLPRVALVPGGTVSTVARNLGVPRSPPEALAKITSLIARGGEIPTTRQQTLLANERVGFTVGAALVANFFDAYYAANARGYGDAARLVTRIFAESFVGGPFARKILDPVQCEVVTDGHTLAARSFSLICASTIKDLGLHMYVSYRAGERDDALHLIASSLPTRRLGPQMFRVIAGKRLRGEPHFDGLVKEFRVRFGDPGPWMLDGDLFRDREVVVTPGPTLRVVTGLE